MFFCFVNVIEVDFHVFDGTLESMSEPIHVIVMPLVRHFLSRQLSLLLSHHLYSISSLASLSSSMTLSWMVLKNWHRLLFLFDRLHFEFDMALEVLPQIVLFKPLQEVLVQ